MKLGSIYEWNRPGRCVQKLIAIGVENNSVKLICVTCHESLWDDGKPYREATMVSYDSHYLAEQALVKLSAGSKLKGLQKRVAKQRYEVEWTAFHQAASKFYNQSSFRESSQKWSAAGNGKAQTSRGQLSRL